MKRDAEDTHDFATARRGAVIQDAGKTRVTMYLDNEVLAHFRALSTANGRGYQTEINATLRDAMGPPPPTARPRLVPRNVPPAGGDRIDAMAARLHRLEEAIGLAPNARPAGRALAAVREPAARYVAAKGTAGKPKAKQKPKAATRRKRAP